MNLPSFTAELSIYDPNCSFRSKSSGGVPTSANHIVPQGGMAPGGTHWECTGCLASLSFPENMGLLRGCSYNRCCQVDNHTGQLVGSLATCSYNLCSCGFGTSSFRFFRFYNSMASFVVG